MIVKYRSIVIKLLFGFVHTQSDDVKVEESCTSLRSERELLMWSSQTSTWSLMLLLYYQSMTLWYSRNNHTHQHRHQLREITQEPNPPTRHHWKGQRRKNDALEESMQLSRWSWDIQPVWKNVKKIYHPQTRWAHLFNPTTIDCSSIRP